DRGTGVVSLPDVPALDPTQLTLEAWVNPTADEPPSGTVVEKTTSDSWNDGYGLYERTAGVIDFFVNRFAPIDRGFGDNLYVETPIPANQWSYVVGTYDGQVLRLYVNGTL